MTSEIVPINITAISYTIWPNLRLETIPREIGELLRNRYRIESHTNKAAAKISYLRSPLHGSFSIFTTAEQQCSGPICSAYFVYANGNIKNDKVRINCGSRFVSAPSVIRKCNYVRVSFCPFIVCDVLPENVRRIKQK